jgi:hypothetical protein
VRVRLRQQNIAIFAIPSPGPVFVSPAQAKTMIDCRIIKKNVNITPKDQDLGKALMQRMFQDYLDK